MLAAQLRIGVLRVKYVDIAYTATASRTFKEWAFTRIKQRHGVIYSFLLNAPRDWISANANIPKNFYLRLSERGDHCRYLDLTTVYLHTNRKLRHYLSVVFIGLRAKISFRRLNRTIPTIHIGRNVTRVKYVDIVFIHVPSISSSSSISVTGSMKIGVPGPA